MAISKAITQTPNRKIQKKKSIKDFFSTKKRKGIAIGGLLVIAAVGVYFMFFAAAAPFNCSPVEGGGICDMNQASSPDGTDALASMDAEVQGLASQGWTDWGVAFRAPNFPQNGAVPLWRFSSPSITSHVLVLEGSDDYNRLSADAANIREGVVGYAWPDGRQSGTVPIYRVNRKPLWFMQMYVDNGPSRDYFLGQPDGSYQDGGVGFYAYPGNYYPPAPQAPAKDTDCANQNLKPGDKGACVRWHKGVINGYIVTTGDGAVPLDTNNDTFDSTTNDYTKVFVNQLQKKGVKVSSYGGVVSKEIWDALAVGFPATPPPAKPTVGTSSPAPKAPTTQQPTDPAKTNTLPPTTTQPASSEPVKANTPAVPNRNPDTRSEQTAGSKPKTTAAVPTRDPDNRNTQATSSSKATTPTTTTPTTTTTVPTRNPDTNGASTGSTSKNCTVTWKMETYMGFGKTKGSRSYGLSSLEDCKLMRDLAATKTIDGWNRKHYDYRYTWK